jgi:MoxR-like ATPase
VSEAWVGAVREAVASVWLGRPEVLDHVLAAVVAGGHVLVEDVPGVGKTTLARALAGALGGSFRRIQVTADLLPSDLTGGLVLPPGGGAPVFRPGPVFANVVLADELNRGTPRAQSALLEAMAEGAVTVDGETRALPRPFLLLATQNPDGHGTWPLPEAQLDRFLLRVRLGYPGRDHERAILRGVVAAGSPAPVTAPEVVAASAAAVSSVRVAAELEAWMLDLVWASRHDARLLRGVSPRAAAGWHRAARALAIVGGRGFVVPEDLHALAVPALGHRVVARSGEGADVVAALLAEHPAPA